MAKRTEPAHEDVAAEPFDWRRATVADGATRWARERPDRTARLLRAGQAGVHSVPVPGTTWDDPPSARLYFAVFGMRTADDGTPLDGPEDFYGYWSAVLGDDEPLLDDPDLARLFLGTVREVAGPGWWRG
jgi:hypothetical protein